MLIEEKPVFFIAAVGPARAPGTIEFLREVIACDRVIDGFINKDIVKPELGFIIANRLPALESVCNIDIRVTIIVDVECAATPGPAGAGDGSVERGLFKSPAGLCREKPVPKGHGGAPRSVISRIRPPESEVFQPI